jgi:hypothetical protein
MTVFTFPHCIFDPYRKQQILLRKWELNGFHRSYNEIFVTWIIKEKSSEIYKMFHDTCSISNFMPAYWFREPIYPLPAWLRLLFCKAKMCIWIFKLNYCHKAEAILVHQKESIAGRTKWTVSTFAKVKVVVTTKDECLRRLADLTGVTLPDELAVLLLCMVPCLNTL